MALCNITLTKYFPSHFHEALLSNLPLFLRTENIYEK